MTIKSLHFQDHLLITQEDREVRLLEDGVLCSTPSVSTVILIIPRVSHPGVISHIVGVHLVVGGLVHCQSLLVLLLTRDDVGEATL